MTQKRSFRRRQARPRAFRAWGVALSLVLVLLAGSGAWAYREVTRQPDPASIPLDGALLPPPEAERLGDLLPREAAVYVRVAFDPALGNLIGHGLSGLGFASLSEAMPFARDLLPGLHAMAGYPLLINAIGTDGEEQAQRAVSNLGSEETGRLLMALLDQAGRDVALALYPPPVLSSVPMGITLVARVKEPAQAGQILRDLERLLGSKVTEGLRLEGDCLSMSNVRYWRRGLQGDPEFKRAIAHLPADRFATMYVDAQRLRELRTSYERFLRSGGELGDLMLAPMEGMLSDPAMGRFLERVEREGGDRQHLSLAATHRLGMVQGFTYSDWQPQDPAGLRAAATELLRAGSARSYQSFASIGGMIPGTPGQAKASPAETAQFLQELYRP